MLCLRRDVRTAAALACASIVRPSLNFQADQDEPTVRISRFVKQTLKPGDQDKATVTLASFGGETTISATPMIANRSTPYSRCARSLTVKNACTAMVAA